MTESALRKKRRAEMPDPDKVQRDAADPNTSVWVGASAGSGKTKILVDRVLRLLLAGAEPKKILCLTFTRAAAAEMANRVTKDLAYWAVCSDNELRESLYKLEDRAPKSELLIEARRLFARMLACPGSMRIRTIHAFCQEILRRFPIEAGLAPHFAVIEENDARALRDEVQADVLRTAASAPDSQTGRALRLLTRDLGAHGFEEAMSAVLGERARLESTLAAASGLDGLITRARDLLDLAPGDSEEKFRRDAASDKALPREEMLQAARQLLEGTKSFAARGQTMLDWLALPAGERATTLDDYCSCFLKADGDFFQSYADKKLLAQYPDLDPLLRREAARLIGVMERCEAARLAERTAAILALGDALMQGFAAQKAAQALLDYDDLVIRTDQLLRRPGIAPWVLFKLDGGLDHILVDEAQDTSRAQWSIIAALAEEFFAGSGAHDDRNRTLFVVGDEKQSIFSFQHADPAAFIERRAFFERRITDADKKWREVPLHMSFRSAPAILRAVDAVFADPRARQGVSLELVEHYPAKPGKIGRVEMWPLVPAPEKDKAGSTWTLPFDYEPERDPQAELADLIATRIKHWIDTKEKLSGHTRPIAPGDIMILLRRRGRFADLMVRALKEAHVPVTGVDRMRLTKQLAVMDLCALMQFALLPEDDLNLACVLRGPLLNLSEEQLMQLAINREGNLWQSLKDSAAFISARNYLQRWLDAADYMTPFAMLARMLNEACPGSAVSGRQALWARLGPDALDPIDELLNAAQEFGQRHAPSLQAFLHWLNATEAEIKRELDRGGGQTRIMTVHAAKGLEAPIVFLPDTANVPRAREMPKLLWDENSGAPLYISRKPQTGAARQLWDQARQKQMEEYRRLFYVALTRAADRLYIGGWENPRTDNESAEESWYALARRALLPLHESIALEKTAPQADIAFADVETGTQQTGPKDSPPFEGGVRGEGATQVLDLKITHPLPAWARQPAPVEPAAQRPLAPSRLAAESEPPAASPDVRFARGRIIHRLLQSLPDVADDKRDSIAARFLANPQHRLPQKEQKEIAAEVLGLLRDPAYAPLFAPPSRAEVPLAGFYGNRPINGQIDRLCVRDDSVWIVDYKSNRPPPAKVAYVSPAYIKQLAAYRTVLTEIYPGKPIKCFLLWTFKPLLMPIPETLLADA